MACISECNGFYLDVDKTVLLPCALARRIVWHHVWDLNETILLSYAMIKRL